MGSHWRDFLPQFWGQPCSSPRTMEVLEGEKKHVEKIVFHSSPFFSWAELFRMVSRDFLSIYSCHLY